MINNNHYYNCKNFHSMNYLHCKSNKQGQSNISNKDSNITNIMSLIDNNRYCKYMWFRLEYYEDQHKLSNNSNLFNSFSKDTSIININLMINNNHYYNCKNFHSMNYLQCKFNKQRQSNISNKDSNTTNIISLIDNNHYCICKWFRLEYCEDQHKLSNYQNLLYSFSKDTNIININLMINNNHYYNCKNFHSMNYLHCKFNNQYYSNISNKDSNTTNIMFLIDNNHYCIYKWFRLQYCVDQHKLSNYSNLFNSFSKDTSIININLMINNNHYYNYKNFHSMNYLFCKFNKQQHSNMSSKGSNITNMMFLLDNIHYCKHMLTPIDNYLYLSNLNKSVKLSSMLRMAIGKLGNQLMTNSILNYIRMSYQIILH